MTKILLLGANHASIINSLKEGLDNKGIKTEAFSFDFSRSIYNNYSNIKCLYPSDIATGNKFYRAARWRYYFFIGLFLYLKKIIWANTVVYYSSPTYNILRKTKRSYSLELFLVNLFVRKKFVWYTGSDIRNPEIELAINPFFKFAWKNDGYEYKKWESQQNSDRTQLLFSKYNFKAIVWDQYPFINNAIFKDYFIIPHASVSLVSSNSTNKRKKIIIHAPSAPFAKGSQFIISAIENLMKHRNDFEFVLLKNVTNEDYQHALQSSDIMIDQLIWGAYGVAAQQALQSGKVVVAYLLDDRIAKIYGEDCPIINANINTIENVLNDLLDLPDFTELQTRSKEYYKKMHSPLEVANKLLKVISEDTNK